MALLMALCCMFLPACKKTSNSFPELPTSSSTESEETTGASPSIDVDSSEITIASSLSYETCMYLAKLYVAKSQNLLGEGVTGETVDLSYLDSIDLPFILRVFETSENGCDTDTLKQWKNSGDMPDVFLTNTFDAAVSEGFALPISDYVAGNRLLSADRLYTQQISLFYAQGRQYGIPYQTSAAVLYCDMEVLRQADILTVPFRLGTVELNSMLEKLSALNLEERTVLPFYQVSSMLPYLPCSMYKSGYLSASVESDRAESAYREALAFADNIIRSGYAYESMTEEEKDVFFTGLSPLLSRKVGIWTGTTDEIPIYDNYMPNTLCLMQIPSSNDEDLPAPLLVCYPLCISSTCENPKLACDLACFFALDEDALLLAARLTNREGYMPCISSPAVWKSMTSKQKYGAYMIQLQELMDQAIYIPVVSGSEGFRKDQEYIKEQFSALYPITEDDEA
ncbi:MAG: hypothetical protein IK020_01480 [Clostridiales bacterium]|nr:hypothetical protein [Clostridiales bacterium]